MPEPTRRVLVRYDVPRVRPEWLLPEEPVPESQPHDLVLDLLKAILLAFVARTRMSAQVARNLAIRFTRDDPRVGVDPDLCLITPRTPEGDDLQSLRLWEEGHNPPLLAVEVVSESNPSKDYVTAPDRYSACGCKELWVFDPKLAGPRALGGPHRIQVWSEQPDGTFARTYAGEGPAPSPALGAWLHAVDEGRKLRLADDREGTSFWMTAEEAERAGREAERAGKEAERAGKEAERAAKEAALARVAALEEALRRRP